MDKCIVVIGAFDTKGEEYKYIIDLLTIRGYSIITLNAGVLESTDLFAIDIHANEVAKEGGSNIETLRKNNDRGHAIKVMCEGSRILISKLFKEKKFHGIIGMGGTAGTTIVTCAMRALPLGLPKICISTIASGNTSPYIQTSDIILVPSLTDISGINRISSLILTKAVNALSGMVDTPAKPLSFTKRLIAASMFGNTTSCINQCRTMLEKHDFEVLVFHATGIGGRTMEGLINEGYIEGLLDITTTEWSDTLCGGVFDAGETRLEAAGKKGIPHLIAPGCIDMCNFAGADTIPSKYSDRIFYEWNPNVTLMRTTPEENKKLGEIFAQKANQARGRIGFVIPLKGFSILDSINDDGPQPFWDPVADKAFLNSLKRYLSPNIEIVEVDCNINEPQFAETAATMFLTMMQQG